MDAQMCKICGQRHHRYEPHRFPSRDAAHQALGLTMVAPDHPRSNARSPIHRKPSIASKETERSEQRKTAAAVDRYIPIPDKPDTAPLDPHSMTNDQLRPFFNEWMRRKMAAKRAQGRDLKEEQE